jgi:Zn-dependent protease
LKVALAGPATNLLTAAAFAVVVRLGYVGVFPLSPVLAGLLAYGVLINIWLALFNLVPIPPLDGSKILFLFIKEENHQLRLMLQRYGIVLLIFFIFFGVQIIYPLAQFLIGIFLGSAG